MKTEKLYVKLAHLVAAAANCEKSGNGDWQTRHIAEAERLCREMLPSGSGFDSGSQIVIEKSTAEKLVISTSFHHMNEHGSYDGWTDHVVTVRPSLLHGFTLSVSGKNRNDIKEYVNEAFSAALENEVTP